MVRIEFSSTAKLTFARFKLPYSYIKIILNVEYYECTVYVLEKQFQLVDNLVCETLQSGT